ncbi:MAG: hypothetical protein Q8S32_13135 [Burkholderiaceae bacterium]|nr:hypothetical protein [Burkholderiaceae bacterium]
MSMVIPMASRRAVPTTPAPTTNELHLIQLHAQACNGLHAALHHLRDPQATEATMWAQAIARTQRALTAMKRASADLRQVVGG